MSTIDFTRARSADAKQVREAAILASAVELATERGVREVTLTAIAEGVGMHKSTMLRYFETREEIFLRIAADAWDRWTAEMTSTLAAMAPAGDGDAPSSAAIASTIARSLATRPLFCDLLAHTALNLERHVSDDTVRAFKRRVIADIATVADAITVLTGIASRNAGEVVTVATSMAGALWQMAAPTTHLAALYTSDPELAHSVVEVEPRLSGIVGALIDGFPREPRPSPAT
ncbi:TetR family transcriptional regulator [Leifsonia poae]|uniref:TetR family transcriptional regulator n=1 Tax=Leifsonia poae TaxID=110933 RepID=UPI001CBE726D|nr:TetR family transcriptional regulator [Leifsonia poae]